MKGQDNGTTKLLQDMAFNQTNLDPPAKFKWLTKFLIIEKGKIPKGVQRGGQKMC